MPEGGFNPKIQTETFGGSDKSWIRTRRGLDVMKPIMLDMSAFNSNHVVNGRIISGTALGKITATGLYGPYIQGAGTGTGAETGVGFLFEDVVIDTIDDSLATATDTAATLFHTGDVLEAKLPAFPTTSDGEVDAAFKTDVVGNITFWP